MHSNVRTISFPGDTVGARHVDRAGLCVGGKWMRVQTEGLDQGHRPRTSGHHPGDASPVMYINEEQATELDIEQQQ